MKIPLIEDRKMTTAVYLGARDLKRLELIAGANETSVSAIIRRLVKVYLNGDGSLELLDAVEDNLRKGADYRAYL